MAEVGNQLVLLNRDRQGRRPVARTDRYATIPTKHRDQRAQKQAAHRMVGALVVAAGLSIAAVAAIACM